MSASEIASFPELRYPRYRRIPDVMDPTRSFVKQVRRVVFKVVQYIPPQTVLFIFLLLGEYDSASVI